MAGIDWEDLLDAEGDELQDVYDEAVAIWSRYDLDEEEEKIRENIRAQRRLSLYRFEDGNPAERNAVRKELEKYFHTKFKWVISYRSSDTALDDAKTKPCLWDEELKWIVLTDAMGRIVLLSKRDSEMYFWGYKEKYQFDWDCIANERAMKSFWKKEPHVYDLKCEYDADGMPLRVYGEYYEVNDDYGYREEINCKNYTVWGRTPDKEDMLTWVFEKVQNEGELILRPVELWNLNNFDFGLVWKEQR